MWIIEWEGILQELCVRGFGKCCIYSEMGETDDMLRNGSEEDGKVRSECEEDEGTACEDRDRDTDW
jgi:hypothetical protein